jgi:hypothetical protein
MSEKRRTHNPGTLNTNHQAIRIWLGSEPPRFIPRSISEIKLPLPTFPLAACFSERHGSAPPLSPMSFQSTLGGFLKDFAFLTLTYIHTAISKRRPISKTPAQYLNHILQTLLFSPSQTTTLVLKTIMQTLTMESVKPTGWKNFSSISQHENTPSRLITPPPVPRTIDELMRMRSEETPNLHLVSYPSSGINYVQYTARQLDAFAFRVAQKYAATMPPRLSSSKTATVIGLLGPSNFDYLVTILALTKLGHTVLFLSTRISSEAYESLLNATGATHLLIDQSFKHVADSLASNSPGVNIGEIANIEVYNGAILAKDTNTSFTSHLDPEAEEKQLAWIIHSSGSTGLPKPIFQTQSAAMGNYKNNMNMKGFVTLPLYHAHGISSLFGSIQSQKSIHLYNASLPLTHDYLLNTLEQNDFEIFYGVPYALKILAESGEGLKALAKLKVVMFGGSACPDPLGNRLVENDVNLVSHYGT